MYTLRQLRRRFLLVILSLCTHYACYLSLSSRYSLPMYTLRQLRRRFLLVILFLCTHYASYDPSLCSLFSPYVHITPVTTPLSARYSLPMYTLRQLPLSLCSLISLYVHITPATTSLSARYSLPMYTLHQLRPLSLLVTLSLCTHYASYEPSLCSLFSPYAHITPVTSLSAPYSLYMHTLRQLQPPSLLVILSLCTHYASYDASLCSLFSPCVHITPVTTPLSARYSLPVYTLRLLRLLSLLVILSLCTRYACYDASLCSLFSPYVHITPVTTTLSAHYSLPM